MLDITDPCILTPRTYLLLQEEIIEYWNSSIRYGDGDEVGDSEGDGGSRREKFIADTQP